MSGDCGWTKHDQYDTSHDFAAMLASLIPLGGQVAGIMHTQIDGVDSALAVLAEQWQGPKMVYAETGTIEPPDWVFENIVTPQQYLVQMRKWVEKYGVQIIGGCCGTGPEHIRALKEHLA